MAKTVSSKIRNGGAGFPNPEYVGLGKKMPELMAKFEEVEHVLAKLSEARRERARLTKEAEAAPARVARERAETLLRGGAALAEKDPSEDLRKEAEEWRRIETNLSGPIRNRARAKLERIVSEHPEWIEAADDAALVGAERERKLKLELEAIQRNRDFAYRLKSWLLNPARPAVGLRVETREA